MGKLAFVFAGQGAQYPGMGQSLCQAWPAAAGVFGMVDKQRPGTSQLCFGGTDQQLAETLNTQPCVFAVDLAAARALEQAGIHPDGVAGFSLGELAAVTFAGMLPDSDGFQLVCKRAEIMQRAAEQNPGGMVAVLRLQDDAVENLCAEIQGLWPVNYNSDGQLVVAGKQDLIPDFCARVKAAKGIAKPLKLSGGFHSPMMALASEEFERAATGFRFANPVVPVYANLNAEPYKSPFVPTLAAQIQNPVCWKQTIRRMAKDGYTTFVEVGPGKTLTGLIRRILPDATTAHVQDAETLQATLDKLLTSRNQGPQA